MKAARVANNIISTIIEFTCMIVFLLVGFFLLQSCSVSKEASADRYISTYKSLLEDPETGKLTLSELQKINPDVCAWLTMEDTPIDYPILQNTPQCSYINRDFEGKSCLTGSLFITLTTNRDFEDSLSIVYGHHMADGNMFGSIDYYEDMKYFNEHKTGTLVTSKKTYKVEALALILTDANNKDLYSAHNCEALIKNYTSTEDITLKSGNLDLDGSEKLLLLSTCSSSGPSDRLILVTKLL